MDIKVRDMTLDDLNNISCVLISEFDDFWSFDTFLSELNDTNSKYFVATLNNTIVGFAGIKIVDKVCDIMNLVVKKDFRGNRISFTLLSHLIASSKDLADSMMLEVSSSNLIAISLYEKFTFKTIHTRKNYYKDSDALIMSKVL